MRSRSFLKGADLFGLTLGLGLVAAGVAVALYGPTDPLPIHYGLDGRADRWSDRDTVGGILAGMGFGTAMFSIGFGVFAKRETDPSRLRGLRAAQLVLSSTLLALAALIASTALGRAETISTGLPMAGLGLILFASGAFLGRVGPNPFVGVRTPWAFKSRLAWDRSNRLAGRLLFLIGLAAMALAWIAPQPAGFVAVVVSVLIAMAASVVESWRVWRADPERQPF